ncbi:MAG: class I mannose-6-phosphate isomerase [Cyclobacteriaceae bacterium]|nr:class I mannose-6-phosphate isomerase [Cyclobacteriaceae bacterium]MCH8516397.1 class I mannose-6-phosphate isomerase [Cyclobacteriaceae bacterium]
MKNLVGPLLFRPLLLEKIWGGNQLYHQLKKGNDDKVSIGESWEISDVDEKSSIVKQGEFSDKSLRELLQSYPNEILGAKIAQKYNGRLPLLIKFIDANQDLSIQVHPDDAMAMQKHGPQAKGKSEMWHLIACAEGASLISGFDRQVTAEMFRQEVLKGEAEKSLKRVKVQKGDTFFIPAGKIHTIGKGCLLAEIQQTSDITYRVYDFDRTDSDGNRRELHLDQALDVLNFSDLNSGKVNYEKQVNRRNEMVRCDYFETWYLPIKGRFEFKKEDDRFRILICCKGEVSIIGTEIHLKKGDCCLLPAQSKSYILESTVGAELLETAAI